MGRSLLRRHRDWSATPLFALFCLLLLACGDGPLPPEPNPSVQLTISPDEVEVVQGDTAAVSVQITRTDFDGAVTVTASGLPAGVSAAPLILEAGTATEGGTLILHASGTAAAGYIAGSVQASGTGVATQTTALGVSVSEGSDPSDLVLYDNVKILDDADAGNVDWVSDDKEVVRFSEVTSFVASLAVGDVLVSDPFDAAPYGMIRRIAEISADGRTFSTDPAYLEDVVRQGEILVTGEFVVANPGPNSPNSTQFGNLSLLPSMSLGRFDFDLSGAGVEITGHIEMTIGYTIRPVFNDGLESFDFFLEPALSTGNSIQAGRERSWDRKRGIPPGGLSLGTIPVWGPVTISPTLHLVAGSKGSVGLALGAGLTRSQEYRVGISYQRGQGGSTVAERIRDEVNIDRPTLEGTVSANAFLGFKLEAKGGVRYVGEVAVGATLLKYLQAEGQGESDTRWEYAVTRFAEVEALSLKLEALRIARVRFTGPKLRFALDTLAYGASGQASDALDGRPLRGAEIDLQAQGGMALVAAGGGGVGVGTAVTNEDGYWHRHFLVSDGDPAEVEATARKEGFEFEPEFVTVGGPASDIDFAGVGELEVFFEMEVALQEHPAFEVTYHSTIQLAAADDRGLLLADLISDVSDEDRVWDGRGDLTHMAVRSPIEDRECIITVEPEEPGTARFLVITRSDPLDARIYYVQSGEMGPTERVTISCPEGEGSVVTAFLPIYFGAFLLELEHLGDFGLAAIHHIPDLEVHPVGSDIVASASYSGVRDIFAAAAYLELRRP